MITVILIGIAAWVGGIFAVVIAACMLIARARRKRRPRLDDGDLMQIAGLTREIRSDRERLPATDELAAARRRRLP